MFYECVSSVYRIFQYYLRNNCLARLREDSLSILFYHLPSPLPKRKVLVIFYPSSDLLLIKSMISFILICSGERTFFIHRIPHSDRAWTVNVHSSSANFFKILFWLLISRSFWAIRYIFFFVFHHCLKKPSLILWHSS